MKSDVEIAIVGGGAAGIAAARRLKALGREALIIEARDRLGGRAHTVEIGGWPVDRGAHWLHDAEANPLVALAERLGFAVDRSLPPWAKRAVNEDDSTDVGASRAMARFEQRLAAAARTGEDAPAASLLEPGDPFNALQEAVSGYYSGASLGEISLLDLDAYEEGEEDWRLPAGYGALLTQLAAGHEAVLATAVTRIRHGERRLAIETSRGVLRADKAIVTLPTPLITADFFDPPLPAKAEAAAGLPLGLANKAFFALEDAERFPVDSHIVGAFETAAAGSHHVRPLGRGLLETFVGGAHADALDAAGEGAALAFAQEELARLMGADFARRLIPLGETRWRADPCSRGAYSYARPGRRGDRAALGTSVDDRIFFAGEAVSVTRFSTVHGAWETGEDAADAV